MPAWVIFAAGIRRLHDSGQSGWMYLISMIPFGSIVLLVMLASGPKPEGARFDAPGVPIPALDYYG